MKWAINNDEALILERDGASIGGVWRGAWRDKHGVKQYGFHAAVWHPYRRLANFATAQFAKRAVEDER